MRPTLCDALASWPYLALSVDLCLVCCQNSTTVLLGRLRSDDLLCWPHSRSGGGLALVDLAGSKLVCVNLCSLYVFTLYSRHKNGTHV
jgi:hypothetical protein